MVESTEGGNEAEEHQWDIIWGVFIVAAGVVQYRKAKIVVFLFSV